MFIDDPESTNSLEFPSPSPLMIVDCNLLPDTADTRSISPPLCRSDPLLYPFPPDLAPYLPVKEVVYRNSPVENPELI